MKGVNKKARLIIMTLILIECFSIFLTYKSFENKKINEDIEKYNFNKNMFAIYVKNGDGDYEVYKNSGVWPSEVDDYSINKSKSYCVNSTGETLEGVLEFANGEATVVTKQTVFCYLYFDQRLDIKITFADSDIPNKIGTKKTINCNGTASASWNYKNNGLIVSNIYDKSAKCSVSSGGNLTSLGKLTAVVKSAVDTLTTQFEESHPLVWEYNFGYVRSVFGYRYFNIADYTEPDNYVWFNNELWRIIGRIPVCLTKNCGDNTTNLVKIIRNSSIGNYQYDNSQNWGSTSWENSYLYKLLNGAYLNSTNGNINGTSICSYYQYETAWSYRSSCNFENAGLNNNPMIQEVYWNTGVTSSSDEVKASFINEKNNRTVKAKVGLMSPSDYGLIIWPNGRIYTDVQLDRLCDGSGVNSVPGSKKVWLYTQMTEPTINNTSNGLNTLNIRGCIKNYNSSTTSDIVDIPTAVRPVVYLKENVYVVSGSGTYSNPYQIAMN